MKHTNHPDMKKIITVYVLAFILACTGHHVYSQNSPISTLGTVSTSATTASAPITVNDFNNIVALDLKVQYNPAIANATSVSVNPLLGGTIHTNLQTPGVIRFGWFTSPGVTVPDGTPIFTLNFTRVAVGSTNLEFLEDENGNACQYYGGGGAGPLNDSPMSTYYIDGSLTFQGVGNAPRTWLPHVQSCPGVDVEVPVTVTEFNNIKDVSLRLYYDEQKLTFLNAVNTSGFPGMMFSHDQSTGLFTAGGSSPNPISLNDHDVLFTMHFTFNGPGTANIQWYDPTPPGTFCEYTDQNNQPLNDQPQHLFYIDGEVYCDTWPLPSGSPPAGQTDINACYIDASTIPSGTPPFDPTAAKAGYEDYCEQPVASATLTGTTITGDNCGWSVTYTFKVTDNCGNELTGQEIVHTGSSQTAPELTGTIPEGQTEMNLCFSDIPAGPTTGDIEALFSPACGGPITVTKSGTPTGDDAGWAVTYTYVVKDECDNEYTPHVTVTYEGRDEIPPTFTCPADMDVNLNANCEVVVPDLITGLVGTDNCGGTVTFSQHPMPGVVIASGHNQTHTVTITADDGNGNTTDCQVTLTAKDVTPPTLTPVTDRDEDLDGNCEFAIPDYTGLTTVGDNCATVITVTQTPAVGTIISGHNTTQLITLTADDGNGNTDETTFTVTLKDVTPPTLTPVTDRDEDLDGDCEFEIPDYTGLTTASDNCTPNPTVTQTPTAGTIISGHNTTQLITLTADDGNGNSDETTFTVTLKDVTPPVITLLGTSPVTICLNDSYTDDGATAEDNCDGDITTSIQVGGSVNTAEVGTYTITYDVADAAGNTATQKTRTVHVIACGTTVSGTYRFYNPPTLTPLEGVTVEFKQGGITIHSAVTDVNGEFEFLNVTEGDYDVVSSYAGSTGGAINALDAGAVNAWGVGPQYPIEAVRFKAGDVVYTDHFDAGDAARINNYFLQGGDPTWMAPLQLWSFWRANETITINDFTEPLHPVVTVGSSNLEQDFYGMVTGDFDLSHQLSPSKSNGSVILGEGQTIIVNPGQEMTIPLKADAAMIAGAASLIIDFPFHLLEIQNVFLGSNPSMTIPFNILDNQLRISWFSSNPINVAANEALLSIRVKVKQSAANNDVIRFTLTPNPANQIGDQNMEVIPDALLSAYILEVSTIGVKEHIAAARIDLSSFPNPASESVTLKYALPFEGRVTLDVYNMTGQKLMSLVADEKPPGKHTKHFDVGEWSSGVYLLKMKVENESKLLTGERRIVINR